MNQKSELELLVSDIKSNTSQRSINKVDEINVMKCMLNDKDFKLSVYNKNLGLVGQKCPHDEAVNFIKNIISGSTGLDKKDSLHLAQSYEFTKRDANFLLDNMRDFTQVYMETGRKMNIMQTANTEACIFTRDIPEGTKSIPDKDNPGQTKKIATLPYTKLVSVTSRPKYEDS